RLSITDEQHPRMQLAQGVHDDGVLDLIGRVVLPFAARARKARVDRALGAVASGSEGQLPSGLHMHPCALLVENRVEGVPLGQRRDPTTQSRLAIQPLE